MDLLHLRPCDTPCTLTRRSVATSPLLETPPLPHPHSTYPRCYTVRQRNPLTLTLVEIPVQ